MNLREMYRDVGRRFLFALWGMLTLVLLFSAALMVDQLQKQGIDPLRALRPAAPAGGAADATAAPVQTLGPRPIKLYFAAVDATRLSPQSATIEAEPSTIENCRKALKALCAGPAQGQGLAPVLPATAAVRALYVLDGGEMVVDFSRELLTAHTDIKSAALEGLMIYGVVYTLTQPELRGANEAAIQRVRFLVEGAPPPESFPAHFDLGAPVAPDRQWLGGEEPAKSPAKEPANHA